MRCCLLDAAAPWVVYVHHLTVVAFPWVRCCFGWVLMCCWSTSCSAPLTQHSPAHTAQRIPSIWAILVLNESAVSLFRALYDPPSLSARVGYDLPASFEAYRLSPGTSTWSCVHKGHWGEEVHRCTPKASNEFTVLRSHSVRGCTLVSLQRPFPERQQLMSRRVSQSVRIGVGSWLIVTVPVIAAFLAAAFLLFPVSAWRTV